MLTKVITFADRIYQVLDGESPSIDIEIKVPGPFYWHGHANVTKKVAVSDPFILQCLLSPTVAGLNETLQCEVEMDGEGEYINKPPVLTLEEFMTIYGHYQKIVQFDQQGFPIEGINLSHYDLSEIKTLHEVDLRNAKLFRADLKDITIIKGRFDGADLSFARLIRSHITFSSFIGTKLMHVRARGADLRRGDFTGADLTEGEFAEAIFLKRTIFKKAILINTDLYDASYAEADFSDAIMHGIKVSNSIKDALRFIPIKCSHYYFNGIRYPAEELTFPVQNTDLVFNNDYILEEPLGQGIKAHVYKLYNYFTNTFFAGRIVGSTDQEELTLTQRHFKKINELSMHNTTLVKYVWAQSINSKLMMIVMEFIDGKTLFSLKKGIAQNEAVKHARAILEALKLCHQHGIYHNDLHSANIMLTASGAIKVIDFSVPFHNEDHNDRKDIFSFAEIFFKLLSGIDLSTWGSELTFNSYDPQRVKAYAQRITEQGLPEKTTQFITRCLAAGLAERDRADIPHFTSIEQAYLAFVEIFG